MPERMPWILVTLVLAMVLLGLGLLVLSPTVGTFKDQALFGELNSCCTKFITDNGCIDQPTVFSSSYKCVVSDQLAGPCTDNPDDTRRCKTLDELAEDNGHDAAKGWEVCCKKETGSSSTVAESENPEDNYNPSGSSPGSGSSRPGTLI